MKKLLFLLCVFCFACTNETPIDLIGSTYTTTLTSAAGGTAYLDVKFINNSKSSMTFRNVYFDGEIEIVNVVNVDYKLNYPEITFDNDFKGTFENSNTLIINKLSSSPFVKN